MDAKQVAAVEVVIEGHNLLILGQSGTGKSYLITKIREKFKNSGKCIAVTGTTGVASLNIGGVTIHSWSGIGDGRFSNEKLHTKILHDEHFVKYKHNIQKTDILIIDELSMLSLKLFNQLEYICRTIRANDNYFGGIQVVGIGDFFQLPPVPDALKLDSGDFCFKSKKFSSVFRHKIILEKVMRQDEADFVNAINDVSKGQLPSESLNLLRRLQRALPPGDNPMRLFARNFDKEIFNSSLLIDLPGEIKTFNAIDEGDANYLEKIPVPKCLYLKENCPVMLVKNLSNTLVNGLQGKVLSISKDSVTVTFSNTVTELKKEVFTAYSSEDEKVVASRTQIPLVVAFGITIHKAQGLTLDRVEVDCSNIFKAGMLGVAIGRARKKKGLRLLNFHPSNVLKPDAAIFDFYSKESFPFVPKLECCKISYSLEEDLNKDFENKLLSSDSELSDFDSDEILEIDRMCNQSLSENVSSQTQHLQESSETQQTECLIDFAEIKSSIQGMLVQTDEQKLIHSGLTDLIEKHETDARTFLSKLYHKLSTTYSELCSTSEGKKTDSKNWTKYYSELYKFTISDKYKSMIEECVHHNAAEHDFLTFSKLFDIVSHFVLEEKAKALKTAPTQGSKQDYLTVDSSDVGKLRYICGRCVAKSKHHFMKLGRNNMYKKDKVIVVSGCFLKVKMLDFLTSTYVELMDKSIYKETLEETRRHQNISQGLTNIKDNVLDFFIKVDKMKSQLYEQAFHMQGSNVLNFVNEKLSKNEELFNSFKHLLQNFDFNESFLKCDVNMALKSLKELYDDMIWRFCRVADNQFRKDMIKVFRKQKTDTLRKRVVESSASSVLKDGTTKLTMMYINNDDSPGKLRSHLKIQSLILKTGPLALKGFSKTQLLNIAKAYNLTQSMKSTKATIIDNLIHHIPNCPGIPNTDVLTSDDAPELPSEEAVPSSSSVQTQSEKTVGRKRKVKSVYTRKKRKTQTVVAEFESKDETVCSNCGLVKTDEDDWIQCDICDEWYDRICQNIDGEALKTIRDHGDWYCKKCCE